MSSKHTVTLSEIQYQCAMNSLQGSWQATVAFGQDAVKWLFLFNGGAAVAVMAAFGNPGISAAAAAVMPLALLFFATACLLTSLVSGCSYMAQAQFTNWTSVCIFPEHSQVAATYKFWGNVWKCSAIVSFFSAVICSIIALCIFASAI